MQYLKNGSTRKGFEECVRETLQRLKQEWQKSPALGQGKQKEKPGLVGRIRKKISQIINAYLYFPFFLYPGHRGEKK
jgi:hypothetical protein